ncbi:hypothetical protein D3C85_1603410 [compost metagenome]
MIDQCIQIVNIKLHGIFVFVLTFIFPFGKTGSALIVKNDIKTIVNQIFCIQ